MRLLKSLLYGVAVTVWGQDAPMCPEGWAAGQNKCYKYILKRLPLKGAGSECRQIGGSIFKPDSVEEYNEITTLREELGLNVNKNFFWIFFKIENPAKMNFPPTVVQVDGSPAPEWINDKTYASYYGSVGSQSVNRLIKTGRNRSMKLQFFKSNKGKFTLTKPGTRSFGAGALCEMKKTKPIAGNGKICWQPLSDIYDAVVYSGTQSRTNSGYDCANWEDESVHSHTFKAGNNNFCRNPDGGADGPWCYTNDPDTKWDLCPIDQCKTSPNEFTDSQLNCGQRPLFSSSTERIIGGRDAKLGEAPYQARIRYYQKMNFGAQKMDHQCGGTLISSCWVLTAAHCVPNDGWFTDKGGAEFWFRVDVGNRGYQYHAMSDEVLDNCPDDPTKETTVNCLDAWYHQTLRVKKAIIHNNYRNQDNDLALIQLHPTGNDGRCARFDEYVQPACLNKDSSRFPAGTDCLATGWGDVNKDNPHIQQPDQLQFANIKLFDFKTCQKNYRKVKKHLNPKRHICADGGGKVDTCQGDSGGPLVCLAANEGEESQRAFLTGVVSFGAGCAEEKYPGVYVPISNYFQWIEQMVSKNPNDEYNDMTPKCPPEDLQCK